MEPQDHEERFRQHEEIMQGLARMLAAQARIETLLARMIP